MKSLFLFLCLVLPTLVSGLAQLPQADQGPPALSHEEVLSLFTARSTPDELARFRQLSAAPADDSQTQALQIVLFKLTDDEMFRIGVTSLNQTEWAVAWSTDSKTDQLAIEKALKSVGISAGGSFGFGSGGWYVPREKFFVAQRALKQSAAVRRLGITVVEPKFELKTVLKSALSEGQP